MTEAASPASRLACRSVPSPEAVRYYRYSVVEERTLGLGRRSRCPLEAGACGAARIFLDLGRIPVNLEPEEWCQPYVRAKPLLRIGER
jgi:hypothetical protein